MRKTLSLLLILLCLKGFSQSTPKSICYVTFVSGNIYTAKYAKLAKKDTLSLLSLGNLKFENPTAFLALYNPDYGSVKINQAQSKRLQKHSESMVDFVQELLEIKGKNIPLYSRGDCNCINPQSCFFTDTLINDKVLLLDSLTFQTDDAVIKSEGAMYFVQFKTEGKTYSQKLAFVNGIVTITKQNFIYKDTLLFNFETPATIGLLKTIEGVKHTESIAKVKFSFVYPDALLNYYQNLTEAMKGASQIDIYNEFCESVYSLFGKPDTCRLNKLISNQ